MSAAAGDLAPDPILPAALRRIAKAPSEGWLTLALVALMALTVAWSLADAAWVLGRREWGDFYAWAALLSVVVGFAGAKVRWPRWTAHLVGAVVAALVIPLMVGSVLLPDGGSPQQLYRATAEATVEAWRDLAVRNRASTNETGHYLLTLGLIVWSVGQFAAYSVFGHRRPLDAVIVVGIVLLGNMAVTVNDQLGYLVIFSVAALCVLARTHAFEEETTWVRRRIGDGSAVRSIYLRGGAAFIVLAVFGSLVLTASASSAPLATIWRGSERTLIEWSQELQRYLPFGGASRPLGFGFGRTAQVGGQWVSDSTVAVTIQVPAGDETRYYWRAVTFDRFDTNTWAWTEPRPVDRAAGEGLLATLADEPTDAYARRDLTFSVAVEGGTGNFVLSPLDPVSLDRPATVQVVGTEGWLSALETDSDTYTAVATVPVVDEEVENGLTANRLRVAGRDYPAEISRLYLQRSEGAFGPNARELLDRIVSAVGDNPYDLAAAIERELKDPTNFTYDEDVRGLCDRLSTVECFARFKRGFCLYYATTMVMLLREAGVPARMAEGFLPGERDVVTGIETIPASSAHAWVEVWFPGYGWYTFDPTGGGLSVTEPLPAGPRVSPRPSALPSFGSIRPDERETDDVNQGLNANPQTGAGASGRNDANPAVLIAVALLLLVTVGALAFVAWRRGPRGEVTADGVWRGVGRTAARFGFGQRPQQTVYEYAGALGEVMPSNRPELQAVARAKVEVAYGRHELGTDAQRALRDAHRRLRVALLRLAFRRRERRRMRGR